MIKEKTIKKIEEFGQRSFPKRAIARELGLSLNTVKKYLKTTPTRDLRYEALQTKQKPNPTHYQATSIETFRAETEKIKREYEYSKGLKESQFEYTITFLENHIKTHYSEHIETEIKKARELALQNFDTITNEAPFNTKELVEETIIDLFLDARHSP